MYSGPLSKAPNRIPLKVQQTIDLYRRAYTCQNSARRRVLYRRILSRLETYTPKEMAAYYDGILYIPKEKEPSHAEP
jgi:hypothetical protein